MDFSFLTKEVSIQGTAKGKQDAGTVELVGPMSSRLTILLMMDDTFSFFVFCFYVFAYLVGYFGTISPHTRICTYICT